MRLAPLKHFPITLAVHDAPELVSDALIESGEWEPFETRLLTTLLCPGDTFVDVGANVGYYAAIAARQVGGSGRVFAVEPDADNLQLLRRNVETSHWVTVIPAAFGDRAGRMAFARCVDNRGDHRLSLQPADVAIDMVRGDDVIDGAAQVVKIDTQGAELMVIRGLMRTLNASRDRLSLIVEFWPQALQQLGADAADMVDCLSALSLNYWIIDHEGCQLVPATGDDLKGLAATLMAPDTGGFMNILATTISEPISVA